MGDDGADAEQALVASAVYYPPTNKIYVFGGSERDEALVFDTTQIYDIATEHVVDRARRCRRRAARWPVATTRPNGKIYLNGGYETATIDSVSNTTWEYDPATDTFTRQAPSPAIQGGTASGIVNGHLLMAGGRTNPDMTLDTT